MSGEIGWCVAMGAVKMGGVWLWECGMRWCSAMGVVRQGGYGYESCETGWCVAVGVVRLGGGQVWQVCLDRTKSQGKDFSPDRSAITSLSGDRTGTACSLANV